jgi:hypothetical protein
VSMCKNKINWTPRSSKVHLEFQGFKIKNTQTHFSNHVQSDNEDFLCASGSLFAICTCVTTRPRKYHTIA